VQSPQSQSNPHNQGMRLWVKRDPTGRAPDLYVPGRSLDADDWPDIVGAINIRIGPRSGAVRAEQQTDHEVLKTHLSAPIAGDAHDILHRFRQATAATASGCWDRMGDAPSAARGREVDQLLGRTM